MADEPVSTTAPNKFKFHFCLFPDGGGGPVIIHSDDLEELKKQALEQIFEHRCGWCHFTIDGQICYISQPKQVFHLRMPDGTNAELRQPTADVFDTAGKFFVLGGPASDTLNT